MIDQDDDTIMKGISKRDSGALRVLYDRYGRLAFGLAFRILNDASLAEEVVQDAFMSVWNTSASFDGTRGSSVRSWFLTVVHHRAIDARRREYRHMDGQTAIEPFEPVLASPDPWSAVSATLLGERVRSAMDSLPLEQQRTIELSYFEGMSHAEIAAAEQHPVGTIKGRARLGLRKLAQALAADELSERNAQ